MSQIMGKQYEIASFTNHLVAVTSGAGGILQRSRVDRKYVYRFKNPLLQPYARLVALSEEFIPEKLVNEYLEHLRLVATPAAGRPGPVSRR